MIKEATFNTGDVTLNVAEGPVAETPLILIHGGGNRWQNFLPIFSTLSLRWHLFALDLRGHGKSGRVPGTYRPEHYASDVVKFLAGNFSQPVILFGHSLGGWIALLTAAQRTEQVKAVILGDPPLNMDRFLAYEGSNARIETWRRLQQLAGSGQPVPEIAAGLASLPLFIQGREEPLKYSDLPGNDPVSCLEQAKSLSQVDPGVAHYHAQGNLAEYVAHIDLLSGMQQLTCPVLLIQGDPLQGGVLSDSDVENYLPLLTAGTHAFLDGFGHDLGLSSWNVSPLLRSTMLFLESI